MYGIDFIDDFDACAHAYNEPATLMKYTQIMSKENRKKIRLNFLKENETTQLELINVIVENIRNRNEQNKNWIIVNAPLDFLLVKKLIAAGLNPIQMVFFRDTDPLHKILLSDEIFNAKRNKLILETLENIKNGMRSGTVIKRIGYPQFVKIIEKSSYEEMYMEESDFSYSGHENDDHNEEEQQIENYEYIIDHEQLMEFIIPVITERLNQYTEDIFKQWRNLKIRVSKEIDQYINFNVIECHPDSINNVVKVLVEDTLYYIKK